LADPASDTCALAAWVDEAQWLLRSLLLLLLLILDQEAWVDEAQWLGRTSNHILADRLPDTSALGSAIDEAQ